MSTCEVFVQKLWMFLFKDTFLCVYPYVTIGIDCLRKD